MKLLKIFIFCLIYLFLSGCHQHHPLPPTMLWVWEAPQDLRSLDPAKMGVAVYIATITFNAHGMSVTSSQQRMAIPANLYRMAVIHLNVVASKALILNQVARDQMTNAILHLFRTSGMHALQLDFSATKSQQDFYAEIIRDVHAKINPNTFFSITALANWCTGDRWLNSAHLPVDLVVPMYFSLAQTEWQKNLFIEHFPQRMNKLTPACQYAVGLATFETWRFPLHTGVPVFVFTRGSWTTQKIAQANTMSEKIRY